MVPGRRSAFWPFVISAGGTVLAVVAAVVIVAVVVSAIVGRWQPPSANTSASVWVIAAAFAVVAPIGGGLVLALGAAIDGGATRFVGDRLDPGRDATFPGMLGGWIAASLAFALPAAALLGGEPTAYVSGPVIAACIAGFGAIPYAAGAVTIGWAIGRTRRHDGRVAPPSETATDPS